MSSDYYGFIAGEIAGAGVPLCVMDGTREDSYGNEHYWNCGRAGTVDVEGDLLCEGHAGELGFGPKQAEYGFDPDDGLNPDRGEGD